MPPLSINPDALNGCSLPGWVGTLILWGFLPIPKVPVLTIWVIPATLLKATLSSPLLPPHWGRGGLVTPTLRSQPLSWVSPLLLPLPPQLITLQVSGLLIPTWLPEADSQHQSL